MGGRSQYRPPSKTLQASTRTGVVVYYRPHPGAANEAPCVAAALERLRELAPPGVICVADSGFGYLRRLCAADAAGLRFVVPLRADTGWAHWFTADLPGGLTALPILAHCPHRHRRLPTDQRTTWKGVLGDRDIDDPDTGATHRLRIAYIWSSEQASSAPRPATAPWPAPKPRSPASATAAAGATTRLKSRSTTGSPRSSVPTSPS